MRGSSLFALAASVSSAVAVTKGFNYGSTYSDGSDIDESGFESLFNTAKALVGTSGFTSARLYTMIQGGTTDTVISAIPAAISTETTLLLGLWASAGQADFSNEITALTNAISQYGSSLADLVVGISVGSEDLYRYSSTGVMADAGVGTGPDTIVDYISQVRSTISGTVLANIPVGHVDTWTAWVNASNDAVISHIDFAGMDAYPYFQNTEANSISDGASLFSTAYQNTISACGSVPVWVTETGWPVSGSTENLAVPSLQNAQTYWNQVGCDMLFDKVNTWWYTLQDAAPTTPNPSFGIVGSTLSDTPLYDLTCSASTSSTSSSSSTVATSSKSVASVTTPTSVPVSATSSISENPIPSTYSVSTTGSAASSVASSVASSKASSKASSSSSAAATTAKPSTSVTAITTASTETTSGDVTLTVYKTTLVTITSCSTVCTSSTMSTAHGSSVASTSSSAATSSATSCPADLNGSYQFPHLIVPVSSTSPNTAYGTQYDGTVNSTVSTIFNFDIPASYAGLTCSLIFLFPEKADLETSSYTFNGQGGIVSHVLSTPANSTTTYNNQGSQVLENGAIPSLAPGNSYTISHDSCPPGTTVSFELSSTGGLALEWFEDYNPSPLGLYVRAC